MEERRTWTSAYPNMLGAWAERTRAWIRDGESRPCEQPPGHPARGRSAVAAGLLARGSSPLSGLPERFIGASDALRQQLAAYSCGGSAGLALAGSTRLPSWLRAKQKRPGEPRRRHLWAIAHESRSLSLMQLAPQLCRAELCRLRCPGLGRRSCSWPRSARISGSRVRCNSRLGRMILLSTRCSMTCAAQPEVRAITKIGVNIAVGTPIRW